MKLEELRVAREAIGNLKLDLGGNIPVAYDDKGKVMLVDKYDAGKLNITKSKI